MRRTSVARLWGRNPALRRVSPSEWRSRVAQPDHARHARKAEAQRIAPRVTPRSKPTSERETLSIVTGLASRERARVIATTMAALGACAVALVLYLANRTTGIAIFNNCITQARFLVLVPHRQQPVIETIRDRGRGALVGQVVTAGAGPTLPGAAAATDQYLMSTPAPSGRDATAIEQCWDSYSPPA